MKVALVRLREAGQLMTYQVDEDIKPHDYVIIEADRGLDYGEVIEINEADFAVGDDKASSLKNVVRKLSP
ncbi:MAG: hypothetical protein ABIH08_04105 [Candidatus Omnitrophota bacterium]